MYVGQNSELYTKNGGFHRKLIIPQLLENEHGWAQMLNKCLPREKKTQGDVLLHFAKLERFHSLNNTTKLASVIKIAFLSALFVLQPNISSALKLKTYSAACTIVDALF